MKIKLSTSDLQMLIRILKSFDINTLLTFYEKRVTQAIIRSFIHARLKQLLDLKPKYSFTLSSEQILAIDQVLRHTYTDVPLEMAVLAQLKTLFNRLCLNI